MFFNEFIKYFIFLIFLLIIFYIFFQFRIFFLKQEIFLEEINSKNYAITDKDFFILKGKVLNSKEFSINSEPVFLNKEYEFEKKLYLYDFENYYILKSISKTDIENIKKIKIYKEK